MEDYSFIIDGMTWSFSRINSFYSSCRREWKANYIDCEEKINSFDGQYGSFCHKILEKFFKGELSEFELALYYEENYEKEVTIPCPYPNGDTKYQKGLDYFQNFSFDFDRYEILGVEKEVRFRLKDEYDIVGYIDLLYRDKKTGEITLMDHKSATIKKTKSGKISKTDEEHFQSFCKQQYLYSYVVLKEYGSVAKLKWNMFNQQDEIEIEWKEDEMNATLDWAYNTIKDIEAETDFYAEPNYYYCSNLCNIRANNTCPYKRLGMILRN